MNNDCVQLICFDLGGVLMRLQRNWSAACAAAGVPISREVDAAAEATIHDLICLHETGRMDSTQFDRELAALMGLRVEQARAICTAWLAGPYPGVDELLEELSGLAVRTACLSNTNAYHWQMMCSREHGCGLPLHRMDYRYASHLIGWRKPDAQIYEHVERSTGIAASRTVFFDDLPANVAAAEQRGWRAVLVDDPHDPVGQMRDHLAGLGVLIDKR